MSGRFRKPDEVTVKALIASAVSIIAVLPQFLVGASAVQIRADLGIGVAGLGIIIAIYRGFTVLISYRVGRIVDRSGDTASLRGATLLSTLALLSLALFPRSAVGLTLWLLVAAIGFSAAMAAVNRYLTLAVPPHRRGVAFGIKQASAPIGTLLGGLAVPLIGLTLGWRWIFGTAALLGALLLLRIPRDGAVPKEGASEKKEGGALADSDPIYLWFALAFGLTMTAASPLAVFLVDHAVSTGFAPGTAGLVLSAGSVASIVARLAVGRAIDRHGDRRFSWLTWMVGGGAVGYLMLASEVGPLMVVGAMVAFALGWGFNGLFWFSVMGTGPRSPASVTGLIMRGAILGGLVGPLIFGFIAERLSYPSAWMFSAALTLSGALVMNITGRVAMGRAAPDPGPGADAAR